MNALQGPSRGEGVGGGVRMSLVRISKPVVSRIDYEAMPLSEDYYYICTFPDRSCSFMFMSFVPVSTSLMSLFKATSLVEIFP